MRPGAIIAVILESGTRLGPYQIIAPLGAGGMGEVYRARDTRLGREVAIKVLPQELSRDSERLARFEREARSSSALNHSNIVTIHDFTSTAGEAFLVMELIRGDSLRDEISRGPLSLKRIFAIGAGVADGLAAAHAAGLIHRDLKPENVMITADGTAKILDFGLAKSFAAADGDAFTDVQVSRVGVIVGTASYMSPEQARGEEVDFRTDQFSLGLMLYEMATGKNPLRRPTAVATFAAILHDDVPPLGDALPEPFAWIVERCVAKNPAQRYGSTVDLAYELRRLRDGGERLLPASRQKARRQWWPVVAGALAIAIAIVVAGLRRPLPRVTHALQAAIPTPEIAQVFLDEVALPVALSPNGDSLAVNGADGDGVPVLWLYNLRSGAARQIAENAFSVGWSSDGGSIAYFSDGKLKTVPIDGGPGRVLCDARPEGTPTWSGDTILYAQYSIEPGIYRVNATGGKPERIVSPREGLPWWPQFLPDGNHFLYSAWVSKNKQLRIGSLDGAPPKTLPLTIDSRVVYANGYLLFVRDGTLLAQPFDPDKARLSGEAKPVVGGVHYFANTGLAAFAASQNGVLVYRVARHLSHLSWVDRTGVEIRTIATALFSPLGRISPDGNRYASGIIDPKQGTNDVWMYDLVRDSPERLTFSSFSEQDGGPAHRNAIAPVWAPDGHTIYYRSDGGGGPPDIFRLKLGEDRGTRLYAGPGVQEPHDVSRDGKWMLFVDQPLAGSADIYVLPLMPPGPPRPFAVTPFNEETPRFSPDAHWVAYQSNASGRPEVYVRPFEGSALATRISRDGGTQARWRGDGKELFFVGQAGRLMSVAMNGGVSIGSPRMLFQSADLINFEPAADGQRFLALTEERTADPPVHILINWPARLGASGDGK